ncbi:MAG: adventurous gliding motility protein AgmC [Hyalangium sp.]|uniref:adventurous gliding motility protein AgmC n=1 Tax=Hyalangium sp. TaxID=2028555 RepID=UPI00389AE0F9
MLLVACVLCASTAMAEPDTFGLGTGRDGTLTVTEPGTVINRYARVTGPLAPGDSVVPASSTEGFAAGDLVMVLQTVGILPQPRQRDVNLITLRDDRVGQWELARIGTVDGQKLTLTAPLQHSFAAAGAQVIRIPEYTEVRILSGASLVAMSWDGRAGGVLAFLARGTIRNEGAIEASGAGFQGGRAVLPPLDAAGCVALPMEGRPAAGRGEGIFVSDQELVAPGLESATNGGGGGICPASGGGGGGNGAAGGQGGDALTYGSAAGGEGGAGLLYSMLDHLTLGGGGGQGYMVESYSQAGAGGGAIFIRGYRLLGGGTVAADGEAGGHATQGGAGGGGAGGSVYVRIADLLEGNLISARGGGGGNAIAGGLAYAGPGGGGGGGRILYQAERAPSLAGIVEAGLAGDWHFASATAGFNNQAQPTPSQASAYRGTVTQLLGGFGREAENAAATFSVSITANPPNPTSQQSATFSFAVTGGSQNASTKCTLTTPDGQTSPESICASPVTLSTPVEGTYKFAVTAYDGNKTSNTNSYSWVVDLTPPDTSLTSTPPSNPTNKQSATFIFTGIGGAVGFDCALTTPDNNTAAQSDCTSPATYSTPAEGTYVFQVRAKDAAGNVDPTPVAYSWVVDLTPPDTSITGGQPSNPTQSRDASFTFIGTGGAAGFDCALSFNGNPSTSYSDCVSPKVFSNLADGTYVFQVRAKDAADNKDSTPDSYAWVVDNSPPVSVIDNKPSNPSNLIDFTFRFSGAGLGGKYWCTLDAGASSSCDSGSLLLTGLTEAVHTFCVLSQDAAGNKEAAQVCYSWVVDLTPPDTVLGSARPSNPTKDTSASFTFSGAGPGGKYWCSLDGGGEVSCDAGNMQYSALNGNPTQHTFCVAAQDAAGNKDPVPACYSWVVDVVPPDTLIGAASKPPNPSNSSSAMFTFTGAGPEGKYWCSLDSGLEAPCDEGSKAYAGLTEQSHTFCVAAQDAAGNKDASPACYSWAVDFTPPDAVIDPASKPPNPTNLTSATFSFSGAGTSGQYRCKLDNDPEESCNTGSKRYTALTEGQHTFCVYAIDSAGNNDASPDCYPWAVDLTPPDTLIDETSKPRNPTNVANVTFRFSGAGPGGGYKCKLIPRDTNYTPCDSGSVTYTALGEAVYTFSVYAVDAAGNTDEQNPATYSWQVDLTEPETTIDEASKPPNPTNSTSATFTFKGAGPNGKYRCQLDQGTYQPCDTGVQSYSGLEEGPHTFSVYAVDAAGNVDQSPATYTWVVDLTAPNTVIDPASKPPDPTKDNSAHFRFSGAGVGGRYRCTLDSGTEEACDSGVKDYLNLIDGTHIFCVTAVDAATNKDPTPDCHNWRVDTTPPDTQIDESSKPNSPTKETSVAFRFTGSAETVGFSCQLDTKLVVDCSGGTYSTSNLSEGPHSFCVYARDSVGNNDPSPDCDSWIVDVTAPDTVIDETSEPRNPSNSPDATFRFSGAGEGGKYSCNLDGTVVSCDSGTKSYTGLRDGEHVFSVYAVDAAGNPDPTPASYQWVVDRTAPETSIDRAVEGDGTPARNPTNAKSLTFYFSGAGVRGKYWCRLDQHPAESCDSSSKEYFEQELSEGTHTFSVYAQDEAGNVDVIPAVYVFKIDRTKPIVIVDDPQTNPITKIWRTNKTSPLFTGTSEPQSKVFLSIDPPAPEEATGADDRGIWALETVRILSDGLHTVSARAIDSAGNEGDPSNLVSFIVDTVPPETKILSGPSENFNSRLVNFEFDAPGEPPELAKTTTFECKLVAHRLNKEVAGKCAKTQLYNLADVFSTDDVNGTYTLAVAARDEAGNLDSTPATLEWTVSVNPPAAPEIDEPGNGEVVYDLSPIVKGKTVSNGLVEITIGNVKAGVASADEQGDFTFKFPAPLEEGDYQLIAMVTDSAHNPSPLSEPRSFTVVAPKVPAKAIGGGLGCTASSPSPWLAALGLLAGVALSSRRRRHAAR